MTKSLFIAALLASSVAMFGASAADGPNALYDKPVKVVHLPLPKDPQNPDAKAVLSCSYYPHFMVKQVDLGEEGAEQLSIIPISRAQPACARANIAIEKVISADDWSGYYDGAKGNYVFFSAGDGTNGGMGFAVFTADGKKIYEDTAKKWSAIDLAPAGLSLKYARVYEAKCPLRAGADACWQKLKADTGVTDAKWPDCETAYTKAIKQSPKDKSVLTDPSVISYDVTVALDGSTHKMVPTTGHATACWLAD
jgi:hypothetical protein